MGNTPRPAKVRRPKGRPRKAQVRQQDDGTWFALVQVMVKGRRKSKRFTAPATWSFEEAEAGRLNLIAKMKKELTKPKPPSTTSAPAPPPASVQRYAVKWLASKIAAPLEEDRLAKSTATTYTNQLERHILPRIGGIVARELTRADVQDWRTWAMEQRCARRGHEDEKLSDHWLKGCWRVLKELCADLAADLGIPNPTLRVRAPVGRKKGVRETRTLTKEIAVDIIAWACERPEERWADEVCQFIVSGGRGGEVYACRELDIDFETGLWTLARAVSWGGKKGGVEEKTTKTGLVREVPLPPFMISRLGARIELARRHPAAEIPHAMGPLLYPAIRQNKHGTWHRRTNSIYKILDAAARDLGLDIKLRPQVFRRTASRRWVEDFDKHMAKAALGWTTDQMVDHYATPSPEAMREAVKEQWK